MSRQSFLSGADIDFDRDFAIFPRYFFEEAPGFPKKKYIPIPLGPDDSILESGCTGKVAQIYLQIAPRGGKYFCVGSENTALIQTLSASYPDRFKFYSDDLTKVAFSPGSISVYIDLNGALSGSKDPQKTLEHILKNMVPGGQLVIRNGGFEISEHSTNGISQPPRSIRQPLKILAYGGWIDDQDHSYFMGPYFSYKAQLWTARGSPNLVRPPSVSAWPPVREVSQVSMGEDLIRVFHSDSRYSTNGKTLKREDDPDRLQGYARHWESGQPAGTASIDFSVDFRVLKEDRLTVENLTNHSDAFRELGPEDLIVEGGCGKGVLAKQYLEKFPNGAKYTCITAILPNEMGLHRYLQRTFPGRYNLIVGDAGELDFEPGSVSVYVDSSGALAYTDQLSQLFRKITKWVRVGGPIVLRTAGGGLYFNSEIDGPVAQPQSFQEMDEWEVLGGWVDLGGTQYPTVEYLAFLAGLWTSTEMPGTLIRPPQVPEFPDFVEVARIRSSPPTRVYVKSDDSRGDITRRDIK